MKLSDIYSSQDFFKLEKSHIFEKYWIYFCQASFLKKNNDTFSRNVCGNPVSVRNTGDKLIAFENICAHRKATIFFEEHSNRPFSCKYHGWVYDKEAVLYKIPNSQIYEFTSQQVEKCGKLKRYSVKILGNMVFINLSPNPIPIEEQFHDEFLSQIVESSGHFDDSVTSTSWQAKYNWKLNFENVLDWNHVRFVHPNTFAPLQVGSDIEVDNSQEWKNNTGSEITDLLHRKIDVRDLSYSTQSEIKLTDRWIRKHINRYKNKDIYYNWYIFPNVNYCSIGGDHFLIQQFDPINSISNDFRLEIVTARRNELVNFLPLLTALIEGEKRVIDEDTVFLESQQLNLNNDNLNNYLQGANEKALLVFKKWLLDNVYGQ